MIPARLFKALGLFLLSALIADAAICVQAGEEAPPFSVRSGSGEVLEREMIKGRIAVIFYETRETVEVNRPLKSALNDFYSGLPDKDKGRMAKVAVVRCGSFMPAIWRQKLRENSKRENMTIYGDWDGAMERDYAMAPGQTNFLIVGKDGMVRMQRSGAVAQSEFAGIIGLLRELLKDRAP